jgi:hypothetical protein
VKDSHSCDLELQSTLQYALITLQCMVNEHVLVNILSLGIDYSPHKFGDLARQCAMTGENQQLVTN